jgi:hypothetical protein
MSVVRRIKRQISDIAIGIAVFRLVVVGACLHPVNIRPRPAQVFERYPRWTMRETCANMPTAREESACALVDGKIYVISGSLKKNNECYDPETNTWTKLTNISVARNQAMCAVIDAKIYVISGWDSNKCNCYDPATNAWTALLDIPTIEYFSAFTAMDGRIYVLGGVGAGGKESLCFNPGLPVRQWHSLGKVSDCLFDKEVSFNSISYPAHIPFSPDMVGDLAFSQTGTSSTLTESFEGLQLSML